MSNKPVINFMRGVPADESLPIEAMKIAAQAALEKHGQAVLQYGKSFGFGPLREWLANYMGTATDEVMTVNSTLQIIEFLCYHFLKPGDVVFTERPTYDRTVTLLRRHQATVVDVPLESDGLNIEALEAALAKHTPKFFYMIPDFQNPAGATCSLEKRKKILELAEKHDFWVIEDGPYRPLRFQGEDIPSMFSLNPNRTMHMFAYTKLISPGVRTSGLFAKANELVKIAKIAEDTYICPTMFSQGTVYEFCNSGQLNSQIETIKALYAPRLQACRDALTEHLPDADMTRPEGGFFLSIYLPEGVTTAAVRERAKAYNLNIADGQAFFPNGGGENFIRLPYCALTPTEINEGVARLAAAVKDVAG